LFDLPKPQGSPTFYEYALENVAIDSSSGNPVIHIAQFRFSMRIPLVMGMVPGGAAQIQYQNVGFRSPVSLKQSEKVVVGSTTMGDKGLIVVISARVLK
jgi:hypothetical protein